MFNLGKGSGTKLSDFIELVEKYTGLKANIKQMDDQPGDVPYTCADVRKAEYLLGYKASVPFEEGIKRTVAWYKEAYPHHADIMKKNESDVVIKTKTRKPTPGVTETGEMPLPEKDISTESSPLTSAVAREGPKEKTETNEEVVCSLGTFNRLHLVYAVYSPVICFVMHCYSAI